ncbi:5,10-methylenetetrahydrofolate reductase [Buchnera aphidicola (Cinara kochiana kochiana)]|uniref:Methylenetetrahydrofolate reductase n=1 Tax=Buchnera aphidicola (Cinara kochiana kochiana) TaxID=2518976 RepID=A0A451D587_9GAMM|nr:methylenetetrahydrofolate reductase [Buchnera aphidicola]VFP80953.1 5,10-methylenetetrahydrofolate reductase [Buchnera aphidicola (Cinara kochiana kochiana)]
MINIIQDNNDKYNYESYHLKNKIKISFEVFPPKDFASEQQLFNSIKLLNQCHPNFYSVTNSIYSKNRDATFFIVEKIRYLTHKTVFAHFTTIGYDESDIKTIATNYWKNGIKHILALRGDLPVRYTKKIIYASNLIKLLKSINNFKILVAAYPELHPESSNLQEDLNNLKHKIDLGAEKAVTQFFFSVDKFLKFRDNCADMGLSVSLIPGILPIVNINQLKKFSDMTNVYIPQWIFDEFYKCEDNFDKCTALSVNIAVNLILSLYKEGIKNFHLYTLNQSYLSLKICNQLGLF